MHLASMAIGGAWRRVPWLLFLCGSHREQELGLRALHPAQKPLYLWTWKWWLRWISLTTVPVILRLYKCLLSAWSFLSKFTFYSLTKLVSFVSQFTYGDEFLSCHFKGIFKGFATLPTDKCNTAETQELKCLLCLDAESPPCPWVILGRKRKTNKIISEKSLGLGELGTSPKFRAVCAWRLRVGAKGSCLASFLVVWKVSCDGGGMTWDLHLHLHTLLLPFSQHPPKGREMRIQPGLSPSRMLAPVSHSPEGLSWGHLVISTST